MNRLGTALLLVAGLLVSNPTLYANTADELHQAAIEQRIDVMKMMKRNVKLIADMVRGRSPYEADKVIAAAEEIAIHASDIELLFPPGSLQEPSHAREEVWSKPDKFQHLSKQLQRKSEALAQDAANQSLDLTKKQFRQLGRICAACHNDYRHNMNDE